MITLNKEDAFTIVDIISKAQEVIRCKDCKWWCTVFERNKAECGMCNVHKQLATTEADDFCSKGERRDE